MDFRSNNKTDEKLPLVTIGMSSYNYARYVKDALDSVLMQNYNNIELIIIDDFSTDNSVAIIKQWIADNNIHCTFIQHTANKGITKTLNEMVQLSKGKYFIMAASDDIMFPERVTKQVEALEAAGEEYGCCYGNPEYIDEDGLHIGREERNPIITEGNVLYHFVKREFGFIPPAATIRRSVYDKVGLYNENILIEDYNFFIRVLACYKIKYSDYTPIYYRKKRESAIFDRWRDNNYERYFYDRIISNHQALAFISDATVKAYVEDKIKQYLKCLAVYNSPSFFSIVFYLLKHGYFHVPIKFILIKIAKSTKLMPASNIESIEFN